MKKVPMSFKVPPRLWEAFRVQTEELFLSRAPFLDYMVQRELTYLREDLQGVKSSLRARRHIAGQMKRQEPVSVNIEVSPETRVALQAATKDFGMVRDAFMSRLIIFLRSSDALLKELDVPRVVVNRGSGAHLEEMPTSPLKAMEAVRDDPLFYVRHHIKANFGVGLYRVQLRRDLDWAACFLDDEDTPGTAAHRRLTKLVALL